MTKLPQSVVLALIGLAAVVVIASAVLAATGNPVPGWFEGLALAAVAAAAGAYQGPTAPLPVPPPAPPPAQPSGPVA